MTGDRQERPQGAYVVGRPSRPPRYGAAPAGRPGRGARSRAAHSGLHPTALAAALIDGLRTRKTWPTAPNERRLRRGSKAPLLAQGAAPATGHARAHKGKQRPFSALPAGAACTPERADLLARGLAFEVRKRHEERTDSCRRYNVKVTGTLRQGAARCRISHGTVRPLAATCPSRPTC